MPAELLIAPPACGKTAECVRRIQSLRAREPLASIRVVVPDRLQAGAFRMRLAQAGGAIGTAVGTFGDLYREALKRAGAPPPLAFAPMTIRLIQAVITDALARSELAHYAGIADLPGFAQALADAFAELKRALVYPDALSALVATAAPAQRELALLYAAYQQRLVALGWADQEGLSWLAVEALQRSPGLLDEIRLLVVDGFDMFTGAQRRALQLLGGRSISMLITLPGSTDAPRAVGRRFRAAYDDLVACLAPSVSRLPPEPRLPAGLRHLQRGLFERGVQPLRQAPDCQLLEARSPTYEAREALRWLKARVVRDGIPLHRCAIFTPDSAAYRPLLNAAAAEFGIPITFSEHERLESSPAIAALRSLLSLPLENYPSRKLLNALRSPYLAFGLEPETIDTFETISRVAQIVEGWEQWEETWQRLLVLPEPGATNEHDEQELPELPRGADAGHLRDILQHVFAVIKPPEGERPAAEWVGWLEDLMDQLKYGERTDNDRDRPACAQLRDILRSLVAVERLLGERLISCESFIGELFGLLQGAALPEKTWHSADRLMVGRLIEARGVRYDAVALLGLSEGIWPEPEHPDPLLDEDLRASLGLEPRLQRAQEGLFYQALGRADKFLLLTRPYLAEGGEEWEPSPYWLEVVRLLPADALSRVRPDDVRPLSEAASMGEMLFNAVRRGGLPGRYSEFTPRFCRLRQAREVLRARRAPRAQGMFEGGAADLSDTLQGLYPLEHNWSPSRLEAYGTCPYYYYVKNVLNLKAREPPALGIDAAKLGTVLHRILEVAYRSAAGQGGAVSLDALLAVLEQTAGRILDEAPHRYGFRPSVLWEVERARLVEQLMTSVAQLEAQSDGWQPIAFEARFGGPETMLIVETEHGPLRLKGVIDRVDRTIDGAIRTIDYKTGSSHMATADLLSGRLLQLPIYALAARDALRLGEPVDGLYWQILAAKPSSLTLNKFKSVAGSGVDGAVSVMRSHLARITAGIRAGEFYPVAPSGGCPEYCPAAAWCWRYVSSKW